MELEKTVKETLKKIKLNKKEKILVALSGGKDSTAVAYLLKKFGYNVEGFHIDLKIGKYSDDCKRAVEELCKELKIKCHYYDIKAEMGSGMCYLRSSIQGNQSKGQIKNCAVCGVIKKWVFNREARRLKFDKIATGHNLDDEAQTFLMNIMKGSPGLSSNTGPITRNRENPNFVTRIKPLFYVAENDVREYIKKKKLPVVFQKCPCSLDSYRVQVRSYLEKMPTKYKMNIVKNFERNYPRIEKLKDLRMQYCEICGEPSRNKICKKCELFSKVK
ncbi:tRNA(Ile)-lysidine synthase [uncultured archaeon]|nr:tRNA(Ile)-lysidine synthase [uncultured archaeon]